MKIGMKKETTKGRECEEGLRIYWKHMRDGYTVQNSCRSGGDGGERNIARYKHKWECEGVSESVWRESRA
jgi:hypothetical protein